MAADYAGVGNELFFRDNTMMLFSDAKRWSRALSKVYDASAGDAVRRRQDDGRWDREGAVMKSLLGACVAVALTAASALAQETIEVPTDESYSVRVADLPANCEGADRLHLNIAGTRLAVDRRMASSVTPVHLSVRGSIDSPELFMVLPKGTGCPEAPFEAALAVLEFEDAILTHGVSLAAVRTGIFQQMAGLRDSGQCPSLDSERIGCNGSVSSPDGPVPVVAVIATGIHDVGSDGVPLSMICEQAETGVACEASGLRSGVMFKAVVVLPSTPSVEQMRRIYARIDELFSGWGS